MSISPIGASNSSIYTTPYSSLTATGSSSDSSNTSSSRVGGAGSGRFADAIQNALSQLGVSPDGSSTDSTGGTSSSTSDASAANDPQQALSAFAQNLFAALQAQSAGQAGAAQGTGSSGDESGANAVSGSSGGGGHHHHHGGGGVGKLESGLQSLISELSSSSSQDATGSSTSDSSSSSSSNSSLDALQQSFNNLLSADGASGSGATLSNFLQSLSQNLHGAPATGNVVSTKV